MGSLMEQLQEALGLARRDLGALEREMAQVREERDALAQELEEVREVQRHLDLPTRRERGIWIEDLELGGGW